MKLFYRFLLLWVGFYGVTSSLHAQTKPQTEPNLVIFKLKASATSGTQARSGQNNLAQILRPVAVTSVQRKFPKAAALPTGAQAKITTAPLVDLSLLYELRYEPGQSFEQVKKQLLASGQVEYVEPLYNYAPLYTPNDPQANPNTGGQRSYLSKIKAYDAWDITMGDTTVVIGILDTGVRLTQEDLVGNIKYNYADPIDGIDNDNDGYIDNYRGWDLADNDNNPSSDANGHGTNVAAIAAAQADNGKGMAGVGFKCKFLPVKIYASPGSSGAFKGYDAIVYAADHGCKVINLSWGGPGSPSAFEQDIINYAAINKNVTIVAAAGNTNEELNFYPASYQNVLSVAALDGNDVKGSSHTFSYNVDIGALGVNVLTARDENNNSYAMGSGSSMATPIVAGAAGLLRSKFPNMNSLQIAEQLRVTADDIYSIDANQNYLEKLGRGRLNIHRALRETDAKSVRATSWQIGTAGVAYSGEATEVSVSFTNYLAPVSGLSVYLSSTSPFVDVVEDEFIAGSQATLATFTNQGKKFKIRATDDAPVNSEVWLRLGFMDGAYTDYQYIKVVVNPDYLTTNVNNLRASVISRGNIGYDGQNLSIGQGVTYKSTTPLLYEGGLLIGYSATQVSDNIRNEKGTTDKDFYALTALQRRPSSPLANFSANNMLEDSLNTRKPLSMRIQQNVFAWADAPNQDFVVLEYLLTNRTQQTISNAYAGYFADWDLVTAARNVAEYKADLKMGMAYPKADAKVFIGIQLLSRGAPGFYAFDNSGAPSGTIIIEDGFTTAEKYKALSGGLQRTSAGLTDTNGKDISFMISSAIKTLAPTQTDTVAFAIVAGNTKEALFENAAAAQQKYLQMTSTRTVTGLPEEALATEVKVYPNPSTGRVTVAFPASAQRQSSQLHVLDSQGRTVYQMLVPTGSKADLDLSHLAKGMYFLKISTGKEVTTRKLVLIH
ncbi:S8 family serine peptidase [Nibribacter ruber]|uniref:S8 family serine peptidase n=1 Tax=Nibribacter ruber TaxID=2698458 RepID=A0A6P1P150_9BACT|nr:S8/S53 family peptidase [Nibribacter ruber]QHL86872.1 S8 family serine peptidase [Nibribacter ruber]